MMPSGITENQQFFGFVSNIFLRLSGLIFVDFSFCNSNIQILRNCLDPTISLQ